MITKEQFEKLLNIELIKENGKLIYNSSLDLEGREDITELPDNFKVLGFLDLDGTGITKLPKGLEVEGLLVISETEIEALPEDTKVDGGLFVNNMKNPFSFPKVVNVNGHFDCTGTNIKCTPEELYVKGVCNFSGSTFDELPKVMEVSDALNLSDTAITELPKGLKEVYGNFNIRHTNITKLNDNLVIHRNFNFVKTLIEDLPKGLIVGYWLNLDDINLKDYSNLHKVCSRFGITEEKYNKIKDTLAKHTSNNIKQFSKVLVTFEPNYKGAYLFENEIGKYINADDIFAKIVEQKGNVYHIQLDGSKNITYLITDGEGRWSHGVTLEEAKDDLIYKISKRNKDDYKDLSLYSVLSFEEAIVCYRVITGACSFGTRDFIENRLGGNRKDSYTISEIIELTEGEYGNEVFKEFFCED